MIRTIAFLLGAVAFAASASASASPPETQEQVAQGLDNEVTRNMNRGDLGGAVDAARAAEAARAAPSYDDAHRTRVDYNQGGDGSGASGSTGATGPTGATAAN